MLRVAVIEAQDLDLVHEISGDVSGAIASLARDPARRGARAGRPWPGRLRADSYARVVRPVTVGRQLPSVGDCAVCALDGRATRSESWRTGSDAHTRVRAPRRRLSGALLGVR